MTPIDIIIPVYDGKAETLACINSVITSRQKLNTKINVILIFDQGPDLSLLRELDLLAKEHSLTLIVNEHNLGFVATVNKGMALHKDRDVLLLNADTIVSGNWVDRLIANAYSRSNIGTVTPFSNNAEICSWPQTCKFNEIPSACSIDTIDNSFSDLNTGAIEIPTAVGFCMYIKRKCLNDTGQFDVDTFGKGYGEENDFCMRATKQDYQHVLARDVYVYHCGGVSFGEEKASRVEKAILKLNTLHPTYSAIVAKHIFQDPSRKWRFAAELSLLNNSKKPLVLHISHGIGGGTDKHVIELINHIENSVFCAMLVPQRNSMRLVFPTVKNDGLFEFQYDDLDLLCILLKSLALKRFTFITSRAGNPI